MTWHAKLTQITAKDRQFKRMYHAFGHIALELCNEERKGEIITTYSDPKCYLVT